MTCRVKRASPLFNNHNLFSLRSWNRFNLWSLWLWREAPGDLLYWPGRFLCLAFVKFLIVKTVTLEKVSRVFTMRVCVFYSFISWHQKQGQSALFFSWNPTSICRRVLTDNVQKRWMSCSFSVSIWGEVGIINSSDESFSRSAHVWLVRSGPHRSNQIPDGIREMEQLAGWSCYLTNGCRGCTFVVWQQKQKDFQKELTFKCWVSSFWGRIKYNLVYFLNFEILTFFSVHILQSTLKTWHAL